jgi:hypothetical protein
MRSRYALLLLAAAAPELAPACNGAVAAAQKARQCSACAGGRMHARASAFAHHDVKLQRQVPGSGRKQRREAGSARCKFACP